MTSVALVAGRFNASIATLVQRRPRMLIGPRSTRQKMMDRPGLGLTLEQTRAGERVAVEGLRLRSDPPFFWSVALRAAGGQ